MLLICSSSAVNSKLYPLYGTATGDRRNEIYDVFKTMKFSFEALKYAIIALRVCLILNNKVIPSNTRSVKAFSAKEHQM